MADSLITDDNQSVEDRTSLLAKWKDKPAEEVLNAKVESDLYIKTLTARLDDLKKDYLQLREQHQAGEDLKTLIDQMKTRQETGQPPAPRSEEVQTAIKPEEIEALVSQKLNAHQIAQKQRENFDYVQAKLKEQLGNDYQAIYKQRLDNLGLTPEFADELAKTHPNVFIKTLELETTQRSTQPVVTSTQRQASFKPNTPKRDWNYYQELKKTNPRMYLDPKIAIQMHDDAIALGDAFGMPED